MNGPSGASDGTESVDSVDLRLRQELTAAVRSDEDPLEVFVEMAPVFAEARRRQRVREVALSAAAAVLVVGGIGVLGADHLRNGETAPIEAAGDPQLADDGPALVVELAEGPLEVTGTTGGPVDEPTTEVPAGGDEEADRSTSTEATVPPSVLGNTTLNRSPGTRRPAPGSDASQSTARSTTVRPTSTTRRGTTTTRSRSSSSRATQVPGAKVFESSCGSIEAGVVDGRIELIDVDPGPGYTSEVEWSGSDELEVKLRSSHRECEFSLRLHHGSLTAHGDD